jgi:peptide chain release factor 2
MNYGGHFEPEKKIKRIEELKQNMNDPDFWNDKRNSEKVISELNQLQKSLDEIKSLRKKIKNNVDMLEALKEENDEDIKNLICADANQISEEINEQKVTIYLDNVYDKEDAIVEIHPGAGGTESCDWASMLYRMYTRYFDKKGYKYEVIEEQPGEEAGIKNVVILVRGMYAYGYLKSEKGVHRLVRISPFDSNSRRHTSFASVSVSPLFEDSDIDIEIDEKDIRIDVYRSTGSGGQGVNTTDSAVRITHLPTKIVVTCQNERSQIQNKEKAMEVLKNKLYEIELQKKNKELQDLKGTVDDINFGSQIRSYVMCPYSMVKDHRTNAETSNVSKVLDGDLDMFINEYLVKGR